MKLIKENSNKQRFLEAKKSADIDVKNEGILEVPEGKKVNELPLSHFEKLVDKKGYDKIIRALNNLQVWNKNDDKSLSAWAKSTMAKLKKKYRKDESLTEAIPPEDENFNNKLKSVVRRVISNSPLTPEMIGFIDQNGLNIPHDERGNIDPTTRSELRRYKTFTSTKDGTTIELGTADGILGRYQNHDISKTNFADKIRRAKEIKDRRDRQVYEVPGFYDISGDVKNSYSGSAGPSKQALAHGDNYTKGYLGRERELLSKRDKRQTQFRLEKQKRVRELRKELDALEADLKDLKFESYLREDTLRTPRGLIYIYPGTWDAFKADPEYKDYGLWFDHGVPEDLPYSEVDEWWKIMSKNNRAVAVLYKKNGKLNIGKDLAESRRLKIEEAKKSLEEKETTPLARDWDKLFDIIDELGIEDLKGLKDFHRMHKDKDLADALIDYRRSLGKRWKIKENKSLEEDVTDPKEIAPTPETPEDNALTLILNKLVVSEYDAIDDYNSAIATAKEIGREDIVEVLTTIAHDENTHVGNLLVTLKLVNPQTQAVEKGEQQALDTLEGDTVIEEDYKKYSKKWITDDSKEVVKVILKDGSSLEKGQKVKDMYVTGFDPDTNTVYLDKDKNTDGGSDYSVEDVISLIK